MRSVFAWKRLAPDSFASMSIGVPSGSHSPREYYESERVADSKSEYYRGEMFAMAGSSTRHSLICMNLLGELRQLLKGKRCTP